MAGMESDALRAYSRIQALLDLPDAYGESNYLLETPSQEQKQRFGTASKAATPAALSWGHPVTPGSGFVSNTGLVTVQHSFAGVSQNEERFERRLHPDEQVFHEILQQTMQEQENGEYVGVVGTQARDNAAQADIAARYAYAAQERFIERAQEARRYTAGLDFGTGSKFGLSGQQHGDRRAAQLQRGVQEQRAERDLWSLLETLTASNLLYDIDESRCEELSHKALSGLPITATILDHLQSAFAVDDRLRKGAVLKEWIEKASLDLVTEAPVLRGEPWGETLTRVLRSRHGAGRSGPGGDGQLVSSLHPDAQVASDGSLLALDGMDRLDQENLLKTIWQLVRCGLVSRAQELAAEHKLFWLSASLQGIATHSCKLVTLGTGDGAAGNSMEMEEQVVGIARVGNLRQPVWLRTCWLYATKLAGSPSNQNFQVHNNTSTTSTGTPGGRSFGASGGLGRALQKEDSLAGVLEMSIYAALCNHTRVLLSSPLVHAWQDKVWVLIKAAHERDVARIVHQYRCAKASRSKHYTGCDTATINAERELFDLAKAEIGHLSTANCVQVFNKIPPPAGGKSAEFYLLNLQAAVMEGRSGIQNYIEGTLCPFLQAEDSTSSNFPGREQVLRVFCHFCIWLKHAHNDEAALSDLLSLEQMYLAVERYTDLLIQNKQRSLVAAYAAFLSRPRRISKYAQLLRSMQASCDSGASTGQSADASEVLQLANTFFPADVMDITRSVVEDAQTLVPASATGTTPNASMRTGQHSRAPPLTSLRSPIGMGAVLQSPHTARHSVRFAVTEAEVAAAAGEGSEQVAFDLSTPSKHSVRNRTATPRPFRSHGAAGSTPGAQHTPLTLPGTPQVGSELLLLGSGARAADSRDALLTRLRAVDASAAHVTAEEAQQLESLRWLCYEPSHRIEAVKQGNRFAVGYLLHSDGMKLAQVRLLLADYLPLDSVAVGDALLEKRDQAVADVEQQYLHEHGVTAAALLPEDQREHVAGLREELVIETNLWDAQVCKLRLWQQFSSAVQDVEAFQRTVTEFQTESGRLLGMPSAGGGSASASVVAPSALARYRSKITRTASTAAEALLRAITCATSEGEGLRNPADGFKDIWGHNESACSAYIVRTLELVAQEVQELCSAGETDHVGPEGWRRVDAAVRELEELAEETFPAQGGEEGEGDGEEHSVRAAVAAVAAVVQAGGVQEMDVQGGAGLSDVALSMVTALSQCKLHLCDVRDGKLLAGGLLFQVLTSYVQVCMGAASVLQALSHTRDAAAWYGKAMQLADLVAAEDHALQLYTMLHRDDLEMLLLGINTAAVALLSIDPDMSIE